MANVRKALGKTLAFLLVFAMVFGMMPTFAVASDDWDGDSNFEWVKVYVQGQLVFEDSGGVGKDSWLASGTYRWNVSISGSTLNWTAGKQSGFVELSRYVEIPEGFVVEQYEAASTSVEGVNSEEDRYDNAIISVTIKTLLAEDGTEIEIPESYTLTVNYVDTEGNVIATQVVEKDKAPGSQYTTEQKDVEGYTFKEMAADSDPVSGYMNSDKVVTYVYEKDTPPETPVVVVDKTADGSTFEVGEIVTWTIVVTNTSEFTAYNVVITDNIPAGLKLVEGETVTVIDELAPGATRTVTVKTEVVEAGIHTNTAVVSWENVEGTGSEGDPSGDTVTAEEPVPEIPVVVVDKTANGSTFEVGEIVTWTIVVTNTSEFTAYNVVITDNIPAGLKLVEGETVTVIDELAPGTTRTVTVKTEVVEAGIHTNTAVVSWENVEGTGSEGDPSGDTVTAEEPPVYTLTVHYVDTKGNKLVESIVIAELAENSEYATEQKSFDGYTFVETTGDAVKGIMDSDKEVTYVYDLNEYTLIVNYVDTEGSKLAESIVSEGLPHGSEYATEQKSFDGYTFVETTGDAVKGIMDSDKEVTYVYDLKVYTLIVNYVDTEGNELAESIVTEGLVHGSGYITEQKSFDGYTLVKITGDAFKGIMDSDKEVTYVYDLNEYTLIVNYVDTEGNKLAESIVAEGLVHGSRYTTEQKSFDGYTFVETTGDAVKGIMDSDKEVTYIYDLNEYTLTVHYVDAEGNQLANTIVAVGLPHGSEYATEQKSFDGYTFVETTGDAVKGIMDSDKEVTYVYDLNEYTLVVRYVDTEGNELKETDITEGLAHGTKYNTVAEHIVGYDCIRIEGDARKGIMDSDKEVIYVYAPVQTPPPADEEPGGDIPGGDVPGEDIPDEDVPLTDIPDEEVPKTGDPLVLMIAAAAVSGLGMTGLVIRRKKEDEE